MSSTSGSSDSLRLGVIGCGAVFERLHRPALARSDEWILVAASEIDGERRRWLGRVMPDVAVYDSLEELTDSTSVDGIMILTPGHTHTQLAIGALDSAIPTFVEKPMAVDVVSALRIVEASKRGGVPVQVGFHRRMRRTCQKLRDEILSRGIPSALSYRFLSDGRRWKSPWPRLEDEALHEVAVHGADLLPWLLGSCPKRVRARSIRSTEVLVEMDIGMSLPAKIQAGVSDRYEERLVAEWPSTTVAVHPGGVLPTTRIPGSLRNACVRVHAFGGTVGRRLRGRPSLTEESLDRQLRAFASRVRGEPESTAAGVEDGFRAVQVIEAASGSLEAGGDWIDLERVHLGSNREEAP